MTPPRKAWDPLAEEVYVMLRDFLELAIHELRAQRRNREDDENDRRSAEHLRRKGYVSGRSRRHGR